MLDDESFTAWVVKCDNMSILSASIASENDAWERAINAVFGKDHTERLTTALALYKKGYRCSRMVLRNLKED